MKHAPIVPRLVAALCLALPLSCATSSPSVSESGDRQRLVEVRTTPLPGGQLQLDFAPLPPGPSLETLEVETARELLTVFHQQFPQGSLPQFLLVGTSTARATAWERRLREEFLARYGPARLPLPDSLQHSPLFMALRLSPRYMASGMREAAQELFRSPVFLASVALSVLVYFSAWVMPEPFFSKSFAAALTVRLALAVGVLELRNVALACLHLYEEAQAARSMKELEAVAERFGRGLGGTALRVLVMVASFGVARALPKVPPGGMGPLLSPPRYAVAGGLTFQATATAHVVTDGTLVVAGAALGTAGSTFGGACADGSQKKEGYQWHHLATDKNDVSSVHGGPWTPLFKQLFDKGGMSLNDPANLVYLQGHRGPHPEEYHEEIYDRLLNAVNDCKTPARCRSKIVEALHELAGKVCSPGSYLHRLATQKP